jgi:arginyl-tRNA synthetase
MDARGNIESALAAALADAGLKEFKVTLEHPAELSHGDYATGIALAKAKEAEMSPRALAEKIVAGLGTIPGVEKIEIAGPGFINFSLAPEAIWKSIEEGRTSEHLGVGLPSSLGSPTPKWWGAGKANAGKKIMVEYTDPNPFKEFHIGHLMSNTIGESISRLFQFEGAEIKRANYQGDVGPHVAKAIWALLKVAPNAVGTGAGLGSAYAAGAKAYEEDKQAKSEIDEINAKIYSKEDSRINQLYEQGRAVSLAHFEEIYEKLGTKFDFYFFESQSAPRGLAQIGNHSEIFKLSDGAVVFEGSHTRVFINSKGLPTYEAKEIGLAEMKQEAYPADEYVYITASEQDGFFQVVFKAVLKVFPELAGKLVHRSHGMMRFAEGKMSSRTGNVVTGESLLNDLIEAAKERAAESRADDKEVLAEQVAVAAIKYQVLRQATGKNIIFDKEKALSLEGDSGPYLQYAYARTCTIGEKAKEAAVVAKIDVSAEPNTVARLIPRFPEVVARAADLLEPHLVTTYLLELASAFNAWYAQEQILDGTPAAAHKVALVEAVGRTLKNGLWILGIPAPEKM